MKVAIPNWQGRVSPVFDVARQLLVADIQAGEVRSRQAIPLVIADPMARAGVLAGLGVEVLVCGVISRVVSHALASAGIEIVPHRCGDVESVLAEYAAGTLARSPDLLMPGCGRGRRRRGRHGRGGRWRMNGAPGTTEAPEQPDDGTQPEKE
jgi:predicted Fe-Mo cluster-binding NifX family protein